MGILILARSALGRLAIVLGMIGATTVLGYMALNVPTGTTSGGNLVFMLVMIALTIAAVLIAVLHPVAWSVEEVRFAIAAPAAAGILAILVAIPLGKIAATVTLGPVTLSPLSFGLAMVVAGGAVALGFWLAGRLGFGPMAPPLPPEVARRAAPAAPAPD